MTTGHQAPWERPQIASMINLFQGRITEIKQIDLVQAQATEVDVDGANR